ncbi:hypothetical protein LguiB_030828 [Lonicera macranthoides]
MTRQLVLLWKDKVPENEEIPLAAWNIFIEREAGPKKLEQRAQNKTNRSKKKDVHILGSNSYSQLVVQWKERTKGTPEEGLPSNRVNMYLHARRDKKTYNFHLNVADEANLLVTNDTINITDFGLAKEVLSMPSFTDYLYT